MESYREELPEAEVPKEAINASPELLDEVDGALAQAPEIAKRPNPAVNNRPAAPFKTGDDYTLVVRYDKSARLFQGEILEIPEVSFSGMSREAVLKELSMRLEDFIEDHRHQGPLPEAIYTKRYPEKLEIPVSQGLFRKLDLLSRQEKMDLEKLASEMLSFAVERRFDSSKGVSSARPQAQQQQQQPRGERNHNHNRNGGNHGGHGRGGQGRSNVALESRENFMEYVRNLEKGGGQNRWKK